MTPWIVLAVYIVGWFAFVRIAPQLHPEPLDEDEWWLPAIFGILWPVITGLWLGYHALRMLCRLATHPLPCPRNPFRRRIKDGDPQRIAELEYELGIASDAASDYGVIKQELPGCLEPCTVCGAEGLWLNADHGGAYALPNGHELVGEHHMRCPKAPTVLLNIGGAP